MATKVFTLQHPGSCTGMFWRADPRSTADKKAKQVGGAEWPRNGSILVGIEHDVGGEQYLEVSAWRQSGSTALVESCVGLWMPFHQGGLLLHPATL